jgi:hypothetical protein
MGEQEFLGPLHELIRITNYSASALNWPAFLCGRPAAWSASSISRSRIARRPVIRRASPRFLGSICLRVEDNLLNGIKLIWVVQSPLQKYFAFRLTQISCISLAVPAHTKGRFAIVTNVGLGMRWTRVALLTRALILRTVKSCGPDAPTLASSR